MGEGDAPAAGGGLAKAALGFGLAALAASWNPLAAPFGLVVGLAAAFIAVRALARGASRGIARAGFVAALLAIAASGAVLALSAGVVRAPSGAPIVQPPSDAEVERKLDEAARETEAARDRARQELDSLGPPPGGQPGGGGTAQPKQRPRR